MSQELVQCGECQRRGLPERIHTSDCPHTETGRVPDRLVAAVDQLHAEPSVVDVDVLAPETDPSGEWALEVVVEGGRVPSRVLGILADTGLGLRPASSDVRGEWSRLVATQ